MDNSIKNEITNTELLESINRSFSNIEEKIETVATDLKSFKLETHTHFNNIETDLKSFKTDTNHRFDDIEEKVDELLDTSKHFDTRIETLEDKVLV